MSLFQMAGLAFGECTQHSVHPIPGSERRDWCGGSLRVFRQFAWLEVGSDKVTLSRPAHQRVTPAVGRKNHKARATHFYPMRKECLNR